MNSTLRRVGVALAAPLLAIAIAVVLTSIVLLALGNSVGPVWQVFLSSPMPGVTEAIINDTAVLYLSGVAVAIGFRMNLFNIGVEGQYRLAGFAAGAFAGLLVIESDGVRSLYGEGLGLVEEQSATSVAAVVTAPVPPA